MGLTHAVERALARRTLGRFAQAVMPAFEIADCHGLIIEHLERLLAGKIKKLAIIAPPRHGKSLLGSVMLPAFALGKNPKENILTVSYGSELSEGFGRRVRNILSDPTFHELFPQSRISPDSSAVYRLAMTAGGECSWIGRGGAATGKGASLLILDDLLKDQVEANSEATCRSIVDWLQSVAFTRLTPHGRVLAIATRWSERDPMGWILQQNGWTVLHLPAFAERNDPIGRQPGQALWASQYPVEALEAIRADVGSRVFACLYQGNVAASQGNVFKRDWFRHYQQPPEKFSRIVQSWDTAFKAGATNDFSVCATFGETSSGIYLLSLYRAKVEFPTLKRMVAELAELWSPNEIYVEDKSSGQSLIQELKLSTPYPIIPIAVDRDKETRASATTGYFESGRVQFPQNAPWLGDLEDELATFPGGLHDDQVDAVCQALNRLRDRSGSLGVVEWLKEQFSAPKIIPIRTLSPSPVCQNHVRQITPAGDRCQNCQQPWEPKFDPFGGPCECGDTNLHVLIAGNMFRCNNSGRQWYPTGYEPRQPYRPSRKDVA
jgi:predicted phage terminase large subunit-like protein